MNQIGGVVLERDTKGAPVFAHIDMKKYGTQLLDFFSKNGIEVAESPYNPEFVAKIKRSEQQIRDGKYTIIRNQKELNDLFNGL
jgi:hypothetical protein